MTIKKLAIGSIYKTSWSTYEMREPTKSSLQAWPCNYDGSDLSPFPDPVNIPYGSIVLIVNVLKNTPHVIILWQEQLYNMKWMNDIECLGFYDEVEDDDGS